MQELCHHLEKYNINISQIIPIKIFLFFYEKS